MKKRFDNIDLLKAIAIVMVVSLHVPLWNISTKQMLWGGHYAMRLICEGVPLFVVCNGYLMLGKVDLDIKAHYRKCLRIFLLIVAWAIIMTCFGCAVNKDSINIATLFSNITMIDVGHQYTGVLWFLEDLLALYLLYPVIWYLYKNTTIFNLLFEVLFLFGPIADFIGLIKDVFLFGESLEIANKMIFFIGRFNIIQDRWFLFYFCMGGMLLRFLDKLRINPYLCLVLGLLAIPYGFYASYTIKAFYDITFNYASIFMVIWITGLFLLTKKYKCDNKVKVIIGDIGKNSIGIYFLHMIVIDCVAHIFTYQNSFATRFIAFVIVIGVSHILSRICERIKFVRELFSFK